MIAMRAYWILPNREQSDDILASDGARILPLRDVLHPRLRPEGFSHGVPLELLEKCGPQRFEEILFAQRFPDWDEGRELFCISMPAGADASGRIVHLGLLFLLEPQERPGFELAYAALPEQDQPYAKALLHRMTTPEGGDRWAQSVRELSELGSGARPATNVELKRSSVRFQSLYKLDPRGLTRKPALRRRPAPALVLLILFAVVGAWLSVRACEGSYSLHRNRADCGARPAFQTGVLTWRFN